MLACRAIDVAFLVLCAATVRGETDEKCLVGEVGCVTDQGTSLLMMPKHSRSLSPEGEDVYATVRKSWHGKTAELKFNHQGQTLGYRLKAFSVYGERGKATIATSSGKKNIKRASSTFKSTVEGKEASVAFHKDGSVKGLFKHDGKIFKISPKENPSFLQGETKSRRSHSVVVVNARIARPKVTEGFLNAHDEEDRPIPMKIISDAVDSPDQMHVGEDAHPEIDLAHGPGPVPAWTGTKWFPGCFPGSNQQHIFTVSVVGDVQAHIEHGDTLQAQMETAVSEASFIYEQQLNIRLEVAHLIIYTEGSTYPSWAAPNCHEDNSQMFMYEKLMGIQSELFNKTFYSGPSDLTFEGATHIFTGCGNGWGIIGLAFMGGICSPYGINSGVNQLRGGDTFLTFAHELGHNFGAYHSFEEGQGFTGGIMDYGDGLLDGTYQFNTQYRRDEMCGKASEVVNNCQGNFAPDPASIPIPTPPPTTGPTSPPTTAPTLPPIPDGTWEVVTGPCFLEANGQCITSPNFPSRYDDDEFCEIRAAANFGPVSATFFRTERDYDYLRIGGLEFHGSDGPQSVVIPVDGSMTWESDNMVAAKGWRVCSDAFIETEDPGDNNSDYFPTSEPTGSPSFGMPEIPEGEWMIMDGSCQINYETGCATSANYPGNYNDNSQCFILVGANFGSVSARFFDIHESDVLMAGTEFDHEIFTPETGGPQHLVMEAGDALYFIADAEFTAGGWEICRDGWGNPTGHPTHGPPYGPGYPTSGPTQGPPY
jgi:hypothetical protein